MTNAPAVGHSAVQMDEKPSSSLLVLWRQNPIFAAMGDEALERVCADHPPEKVAPRTLILEAGARTEHLYVLLSGTVRIFHRSPDGREAVVKLLRAPSCFAELELFHDIRMLESVDAIDEASLARIPGPVYIELLHRHPAAMYEHLKHLSAAFAVAARNEQQVFARLEQRIANLLLSYADEARDEDPEPGRPLELPVELSVADITRSLGAVRRSVSRIISVWQKEGALDQREGRWVLLRPALFEELAAPIRHSLNYQMGMSLAPLEQRPTLAAARLEITSGHGRWVGRATSVERELIIGRQPPARLLLPSDLISPQHCRVFRAATGGRFWLEDLESLNGCTVNGRPVKLGVLKDGDRIRVGGFELTFRSSGEGEAG